LVLAASLLSPLHAASEQLFAAHMVQHELLMVVAAPLLALSRPLHVLLDGVPSSLRGRVEVLVDRPPARRAWRTLNRPLEAWLIHGVVIWVWHIPVLFQATLSNDAVHAAQHLSFLGSGYLFWASLVADDYPERGGLAILSLFTTAVHTGVLGALISFSRYPWYAAYARRAAAWGMTPLADQQLAGLIMWIPASAAYLIAALLIVRRWLRASETTVSRREREAFGPIAR
jgi:cytochrome c oxidase assembly factor CtaG